MNSVEITANRKFCRVLTGVITGQVARGEWIEAHGTIGLLSGTIRVEGSERALVDTLEKTIEIADRQKVRVPLALTSALIAYNMTRTDRTWINEPHSTY